MRGIIYVYVAVLLFASCGKEKKDKARDEKPARVVSVPQFNADSSYFFVKKQVDFGPRIPNTAAHQQTGDYLIKMLRLYGAQVSVQEFEAETFDGQTLNLRNIIASFLPQNQKRILLAAHWDTRPFSDKDKNSPDAKFQGANDGASGVGVLLEIARVLKNNKLPEVGIDIIFFDGEDWGERVEQEANTNYPEGFQSWWCLGSQYWSSHKHKPNYSAFYGILLDMVGAKNAQFHREGHSREFAPSVVEKVWSTAARAGYAHVFIRQDQSPITDDHVFINAIAKIPTINIVHFEPGVGFFGEFHHTQNDNIELISAASLKAVGETMLNVIYYEEGLAP